jgi:iron complex outermembrane receptor protein
VFDLPGGKVRMAVGGQYYTESLFDDEIGNQNTPGIADLVEPTNVTTSRNVASAFGEALIPIIGPDNRLPLLYRLEVDAAGRYDNYSDVGHTLNPKVSVRWDPIRQVTIHGTYGTSFRAPTLCDLNAQCTATVFQLPNFGPGGNVVEIAGGNASLKPETATTESGGLDYHPDWLPGLKASVNYFHINYQNIIDTPALLNIAVFTQPGLYAPFVTHNPTAAELAAVYANPFAPPPLFAFSQVNNLVDGRRQNVGSSVTDGLDLGFDYNFENRFGAFDVGGDGTYEFNYQYQLLPGAPVKNRLNQVNYPLRFKMRDHVSWARNGFGATVFVNYNNAYDNTTGTISPLQRIDAYTTADLHLSYNTGDNPMFGTYARNMILSVTFENLFDAKPPFAVIGTAQEYDSEVANPIGRLVTFDLRKSF